MSLSPEEQAMLAELVRPHYDGKFASKLSAEERCAVLAVSKVGIPRPLVAAAFGIDRRTVSNIVLDHSPHYKETRKRYKQMGHEAFISEFITTDVLKRIKEAKATAKENEAIPADVAARMKAGPTLSADKYEGTNTIEALQHEGALVRCTIFWADIGGLGWQYRGPNDPSDTRRNDVVFNSSTDAWKDAKANFFDPSQM